MSWNYENPKTKEDALYLLESAYTGITCEGMEVTVDGEVWSYADGLWIIGNNYDATPPQEVINAMFEKYRLWWAEQLDHMNMIPIDTLDLSDGAEFNLYRIIYSWTEPEDGIEQMICLLTDKEAEALKCIFLEFESLAGDEYGHALAKWELYNFNPLDNYNWAANAWNMKQVLEEILLESRYDETDTPGEFYEGQNWKFEKLLKEYEVKTTWVN